MPRLLLLSRGIPWRSRAFWQPVGYAATALWMAAILAITGEDVHHPLFDLLFSVPLAGWIAGIAAAWIVNRLWPEKPSSGEVPRKRP